MGIFCVFLFAWIILVFLLDFFWLACINPFIKYKLNKNTNKIQWRCIEKPESIKEKKLLKTKVGTFYLQYRILPSELNKFLNIFGNNEWKTNDVFNNIKFINQEDFINYIKDLKTYEDVLNYIEIKQKGTIWSYP